MDIQDPGISGNLRMLCITREPGDRTNCKFIQDKVKLPGLLKSFYSQGRETPGKQKSKVPLELDYPLVFDSWEDRLEGRKEVQSPLID